MYVVVDVADGFCEEVASVLRCKPGVVMADNVEAAQKVVMVVEAQHRLRLAHLTIQALAAVEPVTANVCLMPAEEQRIERNHL